MKDIDALQIHECKSIVVDITRRVTDGVMSSDWDVNEYYAMYKETTKQDDWTEWRESSSGFDFDLSSVNA